MKKTLLFFLFCIATLYAAIPTYQASGTARSGTGAVTPTWPAHQVGDVALLFVESAGGETVTLSSAAGFAQLPNSPQYNGTTTSGTRITVFWARATSSTMSNPTVADAGNHVNARILTYRGVTATGNPWDATSGGSKSPASTTISLPGVTTTSADELIVQVSSKDLDSNQPGFSTYTNANLSSITERTDIGTNSGNGGGFAVWDGGKALAGATGNTTVTVTSSINAYMTIALKPDVAISLATCGTEDFSAYTASAPFTTNWNVMTQSGYTPNVQNGKLLLTGNTTNISTAVTLNGSLPAANNYIEITFQSYAYTSTTGADGITLVLSDASVTPAAGGFGGSLGYAQRTGINGFAGGWLGFGIDEYGNFSNPTEGRVLGPGLILDSVAVRGSGSGTSGYAYITGTASLSPGIDQVAEGPGHWYRMSIDTRSASTNIQVERNTNVNGTGSYTTIIPWTSDSHSSAPANYRLSLTGSSGASVNYHAVDNFTLKASNCGTVTIIPPTIAGNFDAWDSFRSISDRNISTKIVGKDFNLTIASLNSTNTALQDFNGTVCARIVNANNTSISNWNAIPFSTQQTQTSTFNLNRAIGGTDYAKLDLHWKTNASSTCPLSNETNSSVASDYFSVRPNAFTITTPNAIAGSDFNITFTGPNFTSTASTDYNATAASSFDVTYAERNVSCPLGSFNTSLNSGWSFANGSKVLSTRYSEVGIVDVNISDVSKACASRYANIDCDDANVASFYTALTDLPIGTAQGQITIKPHHFDLNATLLNASGGAFTYLSTDLNMSAKLDLNVSAKNEQNTTTLNYDKGCYAKTSTLDLPHSTVPAPLNTISYYETLSSTSGSIAKTNPLSLSFAQTIFTQGSAPLSLLINFDRDRSVALSPFDFNLSSATLTDSDNVTATSTPTGTATYVYGRARAYDMKTDQSTAPNPIELEVYSSATTGYVANMPQNVLHWYRNLNHDFTTQGSVKRGGFSAGATDSNVSVSAAPSDGIQNVSITSSSNKTVHLDISPWLWYSPSNNYNYSGNCTAHPCFDYQFIATAASSLMGVNSGTFQGSDFNLAPAKTIIKKGVKVFR